MPRREAMSRASEGDESRTCRPRRAAAMAEVVALALGRVTFSVTSGGTAVAIETPGVGSGCEAAAAKDPEIPLNIVQNTAKEGDLSTSSSDSEDPTEDYIIKFDPDASPIDEEGCEKSCEKPALLETMIPISAAKMNKIESQPTFITFPIDIKEKKTKDATHIRGKISVDLLGIKARADKRIHMKKEEMRVFLEECSKLDVRPFLDERRRLGAMMTSEILSHTLGANDPENPMNWPLHRRLYASAVSWAFGFAV